MNPIFKSNLKAMKNFALLFIACVAAYGVNAQSLAPSVIASSGGYSSNGTNSLSYTIGEMSMIQTFSNSNNILTQGFQQPNDNVTGLLDISQGEFGSFVVYPNPAVDNVWYGFSFPESGKVSVALYDALGQRVADLYESNYDNGKTIQQLNVSNYAAGTYFISVNFVSADGKVHQSSQKFQIMN